MNRIKQFSIWIIAFWMAMTAGAATVQAQSVNMSRYITLTVQSGQPIELKFRAAAAGTPVRVVSGSNSTDVTVNATGVHWSPVQNFTSDGTTMTVYGDITVFGCTGNGANLTALDASHNTELEELHCNHNKLTVLNLSGCTRLKYLACFENRLTALDVSACTQLNRLYCYNNNFSTAALNRLYCSLPDRTAETPEGIIVPADDATDAGHADVLASSGHIATGKNWKVVYIGASDIPTTGTETCGGSALTVNPAALSFVAAGEMKPITVTASGAWTAVSDQPWLTLSAASGTGDATVDATATAHTGTTSRTAKVTFTAGSITREVNVTQQAASAPPTLAVSPAALSFVAAGEMKPITVTASGAWTAVSSEAWLTLAPAAGNGNGTVNATAAPNTGATRTATITVKQDGGSLTKTIAVTQAGSVNTSRYITLTVQSGQPIKLDFKAADAGTSVRVVSGSNSTDVTVGTDWTAEQNFTSDGTTMTVYGDIDGFNCSNNRANLTALDVSHNTRLKELFGYNNLLTALDVSACTQLELFHCGDNDLTALDVSGCARLEVLICFGSRLTALDVSACTRLKELDCTSNELPALDVSACTQLEGLSCYNNNFSTAALNQLYCSLPDRTAETSEGVIVLAYDENDAGHADVLASSGSIAAGKNWKVKYGWDGSDIPTTGTRACGPDFAVTPETVAITFAGETKSVTVNASGAWTAECDAPWITLSALSGTGDSTITVTAPAYADEWPRTAKVFFVSGALKDTVTVTQHPKPGPKFVALDYTELTLSVGASQRLVVTAYPKDADINRGVKWFSLNDDIATVSANGTVTALKPGRTDITVVANVGGQQTACRVRVVPAEQMVTVASGSDNTLRIALMARSDADFTLSFDVDLPEGFALDAKKTAPDASLAARYAVTVTGNRVEMKPNGLRAGSTMEKRDLLTLACKAVPGTSNGNYKGALRNLAFTPTTGYALQNVTVPFTLTYTVGNQTIDGLRVYAAGSALHLTLPQAETVHIYNVDGAMVKTLALPSGDHVQPLPSGVYLVRVGEQVIKVMVK